MIKCILCISERMVSPIKIDQNPNQILIRKIDCISLLDLNVGITIAYINYNGNKNFSLVSIFNLIAVKFQQRCANMKDVLALYKKVQESRVRRL